jgi:hypothetical protein
MAIELPSSLLFLLGLLLLILFVFIGVLFGLTPIRVWWNTTIQAVPDIVTFDPATSDMPADVRSYFTVNHDALTDLGFAYVHTLMLPRYSSNDIQVFATYLHRDKVLSATIAAHHARVGNRLQRAQCYMTVSTELLDGRSIGTANIPLLTVLQSPKRKIHQFLEVMSAARLLEIHEAMMRRLGEPNCGPDRLEAYVADPTQELRDVYRDGFQALAEKGILRLQPDGTTYRFTLVGAYRIVWANLPPRVNWRRKQVVQQGRQMIEELEREGWLSVTASGASLAAGSRVPV